VVCMAALSAMNHGRRQLWRLGLASAQRQASAAAIPGGRQRTLPELWAGAAADPGPSPVAQASALAVADFWGRLASFAALDLAPESWLLQVGDEHPFLCSGGSRVRMGMAGPNIVAPAPVPVIAAHAQVPVAPHTWRQRRLSEVWANAPGRPAAAAAALLTL
jgi:hypothetical protein